MATYTELNDLYANKALFNKIKVAVAISAVDILDEAPATPNHTERLAWAAIALTSPAQEAQRFLIGVLARNSGATVAQINAATDAAIQNNVNSLVNVFALATGVV